MQKVLNSQKEKKSLFKQIQNFVKNRKQKKENAYNEKLNFLFDKCYKHYLKEILKERQNSKEVDIPYFLYKQNLADCERARGLAKRAIQKVEKKYGRKHIERCYKALIKK